MTDDIRHLLIMEGSPADIAEVTVLAEDVVRVVQSERVGAAKGNMVGIRRKKKIGNKKRRSVHPPYYTNDKVQTWRADRNLDVKKDMHGTVGVCFKSSRGWKCSVRWDDGTKSNIPSSILKGAE